jgi:hypothetical protein
MSLDHLIGARQQRRDLSRRAAIYADKMMVICALVRLVDQPHDPRAVVLRPPRALIFLRHVAAFFSPFGILCARELCLATFGVAWTRID